MYVLVLANVSSVRIICFCWLKYFHCDKSWCRGAVWLGSGVRAVLVLQWSDQHHVETSCCHSYLPPLSHISLSSSGKTKSSRYKLVSNQLRLALASFIILQLNSWGKLMLWWQRCFSPGVPPVPVVLELTVRWSDVITSSAAVPGDTRVIRPSDVTQTQASCYS